MKDEEVAPPFTHVVWDDDLEKRPDVARIIERGQANVLQEFADHAKERILTRTVIERFHRVIFAPVFPRAVGKSRGTDPDLMYDVEIGNAAMGTAHTEVARAFDACSEKLGIYLASLATSLTYPLNDEHFAAVLRVAWWLHGEMVRIHPFVNGNREWQWAHLPHLRQLRRLSLRPAPDPHWQPPAVRVLRGEPAFPANREDDRV